jgi:hypothetical protein
MSKIILLSLLPFYHRCSLRQRINCQRHALHDILDLVILYIKGNDSDRILMPRHTNSWARGTSRAWSHSLDSRNELNLDEVKVDWAPEFTGGIIGTIRVPLLNSN